MELTGTLANLPPMTAVSGDSGKKLLLESGRGRYDKLSDCWRRTSEPHDLAAIGIMLT